MGDQKHEHGTMSTDVQEKTFEGFVRFTAWAIVVIVITLILLYLING